VSLTHTKPCRLRFQQIMSGRRAKYAVCAISVSVIVAGVFIAALIFPIEDYHPECVYLRDTLATNKYHTVPYRTYDMCDEMLKTAVPVGLMLMGISSDSVRISLEFGERSGDASHWAAEYVNEHPLYYALKYCMFEPKKRLIVVTIEFNWPINIPVTSTAPVWMQCLPYYPFVHATAF
jgi:hypothetical protein